MRKIDDDLLLEMLKSGKTQKDCAAFFHASEAAVSKRLRCLCPPPALEGLTERERRFAVEVSKGASATQAALKTCEVTSRVSAKVIGSQLMAKPDVKIAIDDLMASHGLSKSYRVGRLRQHVDASDPNVSLKALDVTFKLDGSYAASNINLNVTPVILDFDITPYIDAEFVRNAKAD